MKNTEELFRPRCHKHYYKETAVIGFEKFTEALTEDRQQIKDMIDAEIELYEGIIKSTEDKPTKMAFEGSVLALNKLRSKL